MFVRKDLSLPQVAVQTAHAAIEAAASFDLKSLPDHPHLVLLGVKNLAALEKADQHLHSHGLRTAKFYESDIGDQMTALATEPLHFEDPRRKFLRKFQLFRC